MMTYVIISVLHFAQYIPTHAPSCNYGVTVVKKKMFSATNKYV